MTARAVREVAQLIRFGWVGVLATLIHLGVAAILIYSPLNWHVVTVNVVAFMVAFQVSFWGHRYFTFRRPGHMRRFLVAALLGMLIHNILLIVIYKIGWFGEWLSILLAMAVAPIVVYLLSRFWVFR